MHEVSALSLEAVAQQMRAKDRAFQRACRQLVLLNTRLEELDTRYRRCRRLGRPGPRYSLRLRLAVTEGVRNMFYEYASKRADELTELQERLVNAGIVQPPAEDD